MININILRILAELTSTLLPKRDRNYDIQRGLNGTGKRNRHASVGIGCLDFYAGEQTKDKVYPGIEYFDGMLLHSCHGLGLYCH